MENNYKGCEIEFDEGKDCFVAWQDGEIFVENISLAKLKEQIDMLKKKAFERIPFYYFDEKEKHEGEITSFNSIQKEVWVSYGKDKNREKINLEYDSDKLLRKTKENITRTNKVLEINSTMEKLEKEKQKIMDSLDHYTYKELCKISGQPEIGI